jgi:hypothetical protein
VKLTAALLLILALMGFGCASVNPTASTNPSLSPELEQAQITRQSDQETPWGWEVLYGCVEAAGCVLGNNPVIPYPDR